MQTDPRSILESAARDLLSALAKCPRPPTLRVAEVEGRLACLILVWDSAETMPIIGPERHRRKTGARAECKAHILDVIRTASQPLTRKEVIKAFRELGKDHGISTVAKALADLTARGELVNPKDKRGYRLPEWIRRKMSPSLFE
jgi:hypothetical protein